MSDPLRELEARYARLKLLYESSQAIHATLNSQEALQVVLDEAIRALRATSGSVRLLNPTTGLLEVHAAKNLPPEAREVKLRLGEDLAGWVARTGQTAHVGDASQDRRCLHVRTGVCSILALPLEVGGEVRGVVSVESDRREAFNPEDREWLEELATQAAAAIQNTWLHEQSQLKARLFQSLVSVSRTINSTLGLEEALRAITREACALMQVKMASLMMVDETREWLDLRASSGAGAAYLHKPRLSLAESLLGSVIRRKKPLQEEDVQRSHRYQNVEVARQENLVSLLSVPMLHDGQAIGTLNVYSGKPYVFSNEEIQILAALADLSAIAIARTRLYERTVDIEEQLRQKEKLSALGWLAAEVAHEIRNPLTVMKMLYHSLDLKFPPADPRTKDALIVSSKIDQLNKIVERVLDFARTCEPQFAPVSLNELIQELALLVRHKLANQNVRLEPRLQATLPLVLGDRVQLEQAFLNLVLNAAEAMPQGGTLAVRTRTLASAPDGEMPAYLEVEFADTGHGMKRPQAKRVLGSLLRSTKRHGTGLGLAIVNRVVEAHRGQIEIRTEVGQGTSVLIRLPL